MKLIVLNGSSCSGKSSIIKILMREIDDLFYLHYDSLKWLFSKYKDNREKYYKDVQNITLAVAREAFSLGYNVISDSSLTREFRNKIINVAKENNYEVIEINLESDFETLINRFNERVENALKTPENERKIANLSINRFKELFDIYSKEKNTEAIIFRTDIETPEQVAGKIKYYIN